MVFYTSHFFYKKGLCHKHTARAAATAAAAADTFLSLNQSTKALHKFSRSNQTLEIMPHSINHFQQLLVTLLCVLLTARLKVNEVDAARQSRDTLTDGCRLFSVAQEIQNASCIGIADADNLDEFVKKQIVSL